MEIEKEHENTGLYHEMNEKDKIVENNNTNLNGDIIKNEIEINEANPKKIRLTLIKFQQKPKPKQLKLK